MSRSVAAISAKVPARCTVPARRAAAVGPRHAALDGEVDLERARPVAETPVGASDPARQPVAEDAGDGAGREVEHRHIGGRQLAGRVDAHAGLDLAAQVGRAAPPSRW